MSSRSKKIEATIGGKVMTFRYGMSAFEMLQDFIGKKPDLLNNTFTLLNLLFYIGLKSGYSGSFPNEYSLAKLPDLIDEMEDDEYELVKEHALQCLGFTMSLGSQMVTKVTEMTMSDNELAKTILGQS
jgi:hypothetical protein